MNLSEKELQKAIDSCVKEPIAQLGKVQPHGYLILFSAEFTILGLSENILKAKKLDLSSVMGSSLSLFLGTEQTEFLKNEIQEAQTKERKTEEDYYKVVSPLRLFINFEGEEKPFDGIIHRSNLGFVLELEPVPFEEIASEKENFYQINKKSILQFQRANGLEELYQIVVEEVKNITGFDRVMLYKFNENYNGQVVSEVRNEEMYPYLNLWFPSTDIPKQARELYLKSPLRLITNTDYVPSPIFLSDTLESKFLDLTHSVLRSVSPIHIEYLKNMQVGASMSISVVIDEKLWGLIACHHNTPNRVDYSTRTTAEFFGQLVALQIDKLQKNALQYDKLEKQTIVEGIMESINNEKNVYQAMSKKGKSFLKLLNADGFAILIGSKINNKIALKGITPSKNEIWRIKDWLEINHSSNVFHSYCISEDISDFKTDPVTCSGILSIPISKEDDSRIIWFRKELQQSIEWGGEPEKLVLKQGDEYILKPRNSFAKWNQLVECQSDKWTESEVDVAKALQTKIFYVVTKNMNEYREQLRRKELQEQVRIRTEELTTTNEKLNKEVKERQKIELRLKKGVELLELTNKELEHFAYVASHDLQEPLRAISSFSQLLEKRYKGQLDAKADMYINFITEGATRMKQLIMDLLQYSRLHRDESPHQEVDMKKVYLNVVKNLIVQIEETRARIDVPDSFPKVEGNELKLTQLFQNLIGNAIKYRSEKVPRIKIVCQENETHYQFTISDNGIGIEPKFAKRIFILFQRLHTKEEYEGTGIGLALCQKIIEQHGGKIWLDTKQSEVGKGTTFYFTLKKKST